MNEKTEDKLDKLAKEKTGKEFKKIDEMEKEYNLDDQASSEEEQEAKTESDLENLAILRTVNNPDNPGSPGNPTHPL